MYLPQTHGPFHKHNQIQQEHKTGSSIVIAHYDIRVDNNRNQAI